MYLGTNLLHLIFSGKVSDLDRDIRWSADYTNAHSVIVPASDPQSDVVACDRRRMSKYT